ncbi:unnamed protein product [Rotaria sp. Silwood1]|nr:unnamed protein product [Rotaria sp. Silwood1]CAF1653153.1 unnamed protein product [Rotaria sp. Silwood1]CAF3808709.1 unnamed protein product [Rotaria sp. Silwood1]CAF4880994.1 unnamed protein product [Rotaria sp. Silwood1]CAF4949873.1 unnamed protein product [Rotaria sp. Silwood1]
MKSKDIQKVVKIKYENGDGPAKIYRDLAGVVSLPTIKLWIKMINKTGSILLSSPPGCPRTVRTKAAIVKVKNRLNQKKRVSTRKLAKDMNISRTSIQRILSEDLGCACAEGLTTPIILENGMMDAEVYINKVLPIALECGDKMLGSDWTYQQDGARPHTHHLTQEWCAKHFPDFIPEKRWPPNSPDLCPLDYSLWNKLAQCMNWDRITTKATLIAEIKRSVTKVDKKKI